MCYAYYYYYIYYSYVVNKYLDDEKKFDIGRDRDDTPDTVMSSSSPELAVCQTPTHFPGIFSIMFYISIS